MHTLCMRAFTGHVYTLCIFILDLSAHPISFHQEGGVGYCVWVQIVHQGVESDDVLTAEKRGEKVFNGNSSP